VRVPTGRDRVPGARQHAGAEFFAVAGLIYDLVRARELGQELPTSWFLQDIRD
jgi:hypothetical protein